MQLFSLAFIAQREISVYIYIYMSMKLYACAIFKEVQCSLQSIHFNQKVVFTYKLVVAFELVKCFFRKNSFCEGWILFKNSMCYLRCVLCSKVQYSCLSFIMVTFLQADAVFFEDWILNLKSQSYLKNKQFSLHNKNNIVSKYALCPLKM